MKNQDKIEILKKLLENHFIDKSVKNAQRRSGYFKRYLSPSTDFSCLRKAFFNCKLTGNQALPIKKEDFSYHGTRALDVGNQTHEAIQAAFENIGISVLNEQPLKDEILKISARLDSVVEINGELILVEIKSSKNYSLHLMEQEAAPDLSHLIQIQCYFHLLEINKDIPEIAKVLKGREITQGVLLYECKDDQKLTFYPIQRDEEIIKEIKKYCKKFWKYFEANQEPPLDKEPDDPECKYKCSYFELCHKKPKPEKFVDQNVWGSANAKELNDDPKF